MNKDVIEVKIKFDRKMWKALGRLADMRNKVYKNKRCNRTRLIRDAVIDMLTVGCHY